MKEEVEEGEYQVLPAFVPLIPFFLVSSDPDSLPPPPLSSSLTRDFSL